MATLTLPNNWSPRPYQEAAWDALDRGLDVYLIWHRRAGKDDVCLHHTACRMAERAGTYWHLLPEKEQARKAIWKNVDAHTGKRRIEGIFPRGLRKITRKGDDGLNDTDMSLYTITDAYWQLGGSDAYDSLVGSGVLQVTLSEFALSDPSALSYVSPMLLETKGQTILNSTPRGNNHAKRLFEAMSSNPKWFCQILDATQTGVFTDEELESERLKYIGTHGQVVGQALFDQEYMCSFDAAIVGGVYAKEITEARSEGRIAPLPIDSSLPVHTAWDIGRRDPTSIWFFQITPSGWFHFVDYVEYAFKRLSFYIERLRAKGYTYGRHIGPHDLNKTEFGSGQSSYEIALGLGVQFQVLPNSSLIDGINAARELFSKSRFDSVRCERGLDCLTNYRYEWDEQKQRPSVTPIHDWASHGSDAFRYAAVGQKHATLSAPRKPLIQSKRHIV